MNPFADAHAFVENLVRKLAVAGLVVGLVVGGWLYLSRDPGGAELLERANPGWTVVAVDGLPVRVDDASGRGDVMISADDLGPSRIQRVDCDEVRKVYPSWFALPDVPLGNCARLDDAEETRWVLNVRTPMPVTQIWDRHFAPLLDRLQLRHWGGRSGRFPEGVETDLPAGQAPPEEHGAGVYIVDPRPGSAERQVAITFYRYAGTTELVFTFRPLPPAPPTPP
ncbi:MAG: hypothetical protein ABIQ06_13025 [Caldimonas sp.]